MMDWIGLMRLGLSELRLRPKDFWDLTPVELLMVLGQIKGQGAVLGRQRLEELIAQYPDKQDKI